jgi:hypothetical protein
LPQPEVSSDVFIDDNDISSMLEELKEIISKKAEKQIAEIHFRRGTSGKDPRKEETKRPKKKKKKEGVTLHPRGGAPSGRFTLPTPETSPRLEFGFKPITTQSFPSSTTAAPFRFSFDEADQVPIRRLQHLNTCNAGVVVG